MPSGTIGLVALRASDGQPIWTSVDTDSTARLTFCPDPTICGRCVFTTALDGTGPQASLLLLSLGYHNRRRAMANEHRRHGHPGRPSSSQSNARR